MKLASYFLCKCILKHSSNYITHYLRVSINYQQRYIQYKSMESLSTSLTITTTSFPALSSLSQGFHLLASHSGSLPKC